MPDRMPECMLKQMPEQMPEKMPERTSEQMPARLPNRLPKRISEYTPASMPDRMSELLPERMTDRMSEYMPDSMSERLSEIFKYIGIIKYTYVYTCIYIFLQHLSLYIYICHFCFQYMSEQCVRVGITRSKVFLLNIWSPHLPFNHQFPINIGMK